MSQFYRSFSYGKVWIYWVSLPLCLPLQLMHSSCLSDCDRDTDSGVSVCCVNPNSAPHSLLAPFESGTLQKKNRPGKPEVKRVKRSHSYCLLQNNTQRFAQLCQNTLLCDIWCFVVSVFLCCALGHDYSTVESEVADSFLSFCKSHSSLTGCFSSKLGNLNMINVNTVITPH